MGMVCSLQRITSSDVERISAAPEVAVALMEESDVESLPVEIVRPRGCLGFLLRLTPITIEQVAPRPDGEDLPLPVMDPRRMEIDKVWDVMNFLMTGTAMGGEPPAAFLVTGGRSLETDDDETDLRMFTPEEVKAIDDHLRSLTLDDLRARIDIPRMVKERVLSKSRGNEPPGRTNEYLEQVLAEFDPLREFVAVAAANFEGLLVRLN